MEKSLNEQANFYNTAEKPSENTIQNNNNVLFYSDGFQRMANSNNIHSNLFIYNESQGNYQPLSKFYNSNQQKEKGEENVIQNYYIDQNYNSQSVKIYSKTEHKNISESAEFRNDESLNDRDDNDKEAERNDNGNEGIIPEQNEEILESGENQKFFKSFNSHKTKWVGFRGDLGETV